MYFDVGAEEKAYNLTVFNTCELKGLIETESLNIPPRESLLLDTIEMPYYLVADDALKTTTTCIQTAKMNCHKK